MKRLGYISAILTLLLATAAAADYSDVRVTKLENGLTILTKEVRVAPVVSVNVFYKVGSRNEHTGITGSSHLLEHMMFKGTPNFPKGTMEQLVRQRGGINNAATWTDYTYYWELIQSDYLDLMLQIEADRMQNAIFDPADFTSEMVVVRSELEGGENSPDRLLWQLVNSTAFQAHPYQWPVIGWRSDVEGMSRDQVYAYYKSHYAPNNATVILVGDFETDAAIEMVKKHFGPLEPAPELPGVHTAEPPQQGERRAMLSIPGSSDRSIAAWHIPEGTHPDIYALDVLDQILSGGRSSRLHQALVETGLATTAWSYSGSKTDPSLFYVSATGQKDRTYQELEEALLAEVARIKEAPPTQAELDRAVRQIEAAFIFSNDDIRSQAQVIGNFALTVGLDRLSEYLPAIRKVTPGDVQRVASTYFTPDKRTVVNFTPSGEQPEAPSGGPGGVVHHTRSRTDLPDARPYRPTDDYVAQAPAQPAQPRANASTQELLPERFELDNGLVLIVLNNPANPSISMAGRLNAGSWMESVLDTEGEFPDGTAGFVANMLTRGTQDKTSLEFATAVEDIGASLSFSGGTEGTYISGRSLSRDFETWITLFAEALRQPAFREEELNKLRSETISALNQQMESPDSVAERALNNKLYPQNHPYHPGTFEEAREAYSNITPSHLRDFHSRYFGPKGLVLTVVGDITPEAAHRLVREHLGDWKPQPGFAEVSIPDVQRQGYGEEFIEMPGKTETSILYGWAGGLTRTMHEYYAAVVMNDILGGGVLTSRLGRAIRVEKGLVYDVRSGFQAALGAGPFQASLGTNPANAQDAIEELRRVISDMHQNGPTAEEVDDSRRFITGVLSLRLATNSGIAGFLETAEVYGLGLDYLRDFRDLYGSVTAEQARQAARELLHPDAATLVVVGPEYKVNDTEQDPP